MTKIFDHIRFATTLKGLLVLTCIEETHRIVSETHMT